MSFLPALPPIDWKFVLEERIRIERRDDQDFSNLLSDGRTRLDNRFRIGWDFTSGKNISGQIRYQYLHSLFWTDKLNNSDENSDLLLANVALKTTSGTLTVGRQFVTKGNKRIIDVSDYSQRSKVFDVVRFKGKDWDAMAGKVAMTSNIKDYSKISMGAYTWAAGETMAIYHYDQPTGLNDWTLDHRYAYSKNGLDAEIEGALQQGTSAGKKLNSFFAHARASYAIDPKLSVYSEANVASGGSSATNTHLFDPLYGTGHAPYGLMDLQGLRNMRQFELGVQYKFTKDLSGLVSFNGYGLYDRTDGWYNTGGSINKRPGGTYVDPTGTSGSDVGKEYDIAFAWTPNPRNIVALEFGIFQPGHFVSSLNGGSNRDQVWGLLSYTIKF